ncbi:MAG TPA: transglutaminase family protein [Acidimicrobiia bacterium]|nr:transglutaminase family protein [Acidimicrobiia bacterium]
MIKVAIEHRSTYEFDRPVQLLPHVIRLRPAPHCRTPVLAYSLTVEPGGHFTNWQQDPFGNYLARLVFPALVDRLDITVDLLADMTVINPFDFFLDEDARTYPFDYDAALARDLAPYLRIGDSGPLLDDRVAAAEALPPPDGISVNDFLVELNRTVQREVEYTIRLEPGVQTPEETLQKGVGSCRDSAWLLVALLRRLGLAARFVSGYLVQLTADTAPLDGPAGPANDFTDLHAWAEAYIPGAGWIGLDPTSGLLAGEGHLPLACTPEPSSAAPIEGATEVADVTFTYSNRVRRVFEDPRVTLPYTEAQWEAIDALGRAVDADLTAGDVRLTLGGEPTFVSVDDMAGDEWNTAAVGPTKYGLALDLTRRLVNRFAATVPGVAGSILHHGQGKWYPGEPLPRWNIAVYWRADGVPLWTDPSLLAEPAPPVVVDDEEDKDHQDEDETKPQHHPPRRDPADQADQADDHRARDLALAIAARLGIPADCCVPAYEDPAHELWIEASLPPDLPADARARREVVERLDAAKGSPAGWVVPVHHLPTGGRPGASGWATTRWEPARGHIFLVPGDSPLGLRLPLRSLVAKPTPRPPDRSPFEDRPPLGPHPFAAAPAAAVVPPARVVPPQEALTTALCVERREGRLHVFLPPFRHLEYCVQLLAAVESAVAATGEPVALEGYPPPADRRLGQFGVSPDPGVIEVNVQPSASWPQLVATVTAVYEETHQARLGTEKFALDGHHTGTGGGNHMTLGGPTAADSPLLRRPDLLRSLITYWQHHPSLSYLFSGRFIGPTSQAPRIDEARHDSLDELEIAFSELDRIDDDKKRPFLIDRLLRHLLVDVTGNTHRAEFCIDKLFDPAGERGRLGLVELRAFEMPPHHRMALVQALLVRALVARCWREPYQGPLVRWGTALHDRFLLPFHVAADIADVTEDLRRHGYPFETAWLAPFLEFRFPRLGSVAVDGVRLELRMGVEPWPVLGEEAVAGATARHVDSSVERLQVLAENLTEGRHVVTCNGVPVPLHATGEPGTAVAGVRYRAWQPPSCLHPTIGVHAPLVFDVVDTWNGRSVGGCTYHVAHPGGRAYDRFPVNANEAEARRTSRFQPFGHTPGLLDAARSAALADHTAGIAPGHPHTLDLLRVRLPRPAP